MKYIIPTIDVEALRSLSRLGNFEQLIMGQIGDDFFGATKIAEIINEYDGSGTFYIDFAEHKHGLDKLTRLSEKIMDLKSDVQLHIHPQFIADTNRYLLNQYSKEEQREVLKKCINIFKTCVNENPLSFRAGGYGADNNTLEILEENNILIDSSYFKNHIWCKTDDFPINKVSRYKKLIEIPVTVFQNNIKYKFLGVTLKSKKIIKKLDIDSCSKEELKLGFDALERGGVKIIILFLHSFSLFKRSYNYKTIKPNNNNIEKLRFILNYSQEHDYKITSIKNIKNELINFSNEPEIFPEIVTKRNLIISLYITMSKIIRDLIRGK